jgi:RND family efflux transporter MFP subunit
MSTRRRGHRAVRWVLLAGVAVIAAGVGVAAYRYSLPTVTVTEVVRAPVVAAFYATGTLSPVREHPVKARVEGMLERLDDGPLIDKGSRVKQGQVLMKVVNKERELIASRAAAELEEKRARGDEKTSPVLSEFDAKLKGTLELLDLAHAEQRRILRGLETRAATQSDLDRAMDRVKQFATEAESLKAQKAAMALRLKADLEVAEAAYRIALWNLDQQLLRSPVDGVVLDRPASPGTHLAINDHVMQVADVRPENLVMRAAVDEEDMTHVRDGQEVRMTLYSFPDRVFTGRVAKIYDKADPERRTFEVDVAPEQPDPRMSAGMTGELAFVIEARAEAAVVPSQALQGKRLYTIRDGKLSGVDAKIGLTSVERVEVVDGLKVGDRVVISPVAGLREGQAVRTTFMEPVAAAGINKPKPKELFRGGF